MSYIPKAGLGSVGNYQVSGIPFTTGSLSVPGNASAPLEIIFPSVTQVVHVHNHDGANSLRVGFSANGVKGTNYWIVDHEDSNGKGQSYYSLRVKTDRIFLLGHTATAVTGAYVSAELTGIVLDYNLATTYSGSSGVG
jgi:hypothetical protein